MNNSIENSKNLQTCLGILRNQGTNSAWQNQGGYCKCWRWCLNRFFKGGAIGHYSSFCDKIFDIYMLKGEIFIWIHVFNGSDSSWLRKYSDVEHIKEMWSESKERGIQEKTRQCVLPKYCSWWAISSNWMETCLSPATNNAIVLLIYQEMNPLNYSFHNLSFWKHDLWALVMP